MSACRPGRSGAGQGKIWGGQGHGRAFSENFKRSENPKHSSDLDYFWRGSMASPQSFIFEIFARLRGAKLHEKLREQGDLPLPVIQTRRYVHNCYHVQCLNSVLSRMVDLTAWSTLETLRQSLNVHNGLSNSLGHPSRELSRVFPHPVHPLPDPVNSF